MSNETKKIVKEIFGEQLTQYFHLSETKLKKALERVDQMKLILGEEV
jgi:hypothetical protein